jgi:FAD/FMN-containing dehydrogenase
LSRQGEIFGAVKAVSQKYGVETAILASSGSGLMYLYFAADADAAFKIIGDFQVQAHSFGGFFTLERAPLQIRKISSIWVRPAGAAIIHGLKKAFDPRHVLNPGKAGEGI